MLKTSTNSKQRTPQNYTHWDDFDPHEYALRNYGKKLLEEDRLIVKKVINALHKHNVKPHEWHKVSDVGAGPNLYPSMLLAPFVKPAHDGGQLDLIEYSPANRQYLQSVLKGEHPHASLKDCWHKFEELMRTECFLWHNAFNETREKAKVVAGSIFELPKDTYDAVTSYFVAESITDDLATCQKALHSLVDSLKPGGFMAVAHMLGSRNYPAGEDTTFPAVPVTVDSLREMYKGKASVDIEQVDAKPGARKGYHGMAIVTGVKL